MNHLPLSKPLSKHEPLYDPYTTSYDLPTTLHESPTPTQTQITQTLVHRVRVRVKRNMTQQGWACPERPNPTQTCWDHMQRELFPTRMTRWCVMGALTITPHWSTNPCETWSRTHTTCIEYQSRVARTSWSAIRTLIAILHDRLTNRRNADRALESCTWPPPHQSLHSLYRGLMRRPNMPPLEIFTPIWRTHHTSPKADFLCFELILYSWQCISNYPYITKRWGAWTPHFVLTPQKTLQT